MSTEKMFTAYAEIDRFVVLGANEMISVKLKCRTCEERIATKYDEREDRFGDAAERNAKQVIFYAVRKMLKRNPEDFNIVASHLDHYIVEFK